MRRSIAAALTLLVVAVAGPPASAQQPGMVRVIDVHVQPGHQEHMESLIPKLWANMKKAGAKAPIFVASGLSEPGTYTFVVPMSSFADLAAQEEAFGKAFGADPGLAQEIFAMTTSVDDEVWASRPDLGYVPATPRLKMEEMGFSRMALLYVKPDQTEAFEAALEERAAVRRKHGIADGMEVSQMILGSDGPVYATFLSGKDEIDFHTQNAKNIEKMGGEWEASMARSGPMLRRVQLVTFVAEPQLNYTP
jgi:hypothetical protein